jgi:hypothetical protein
MIGGDMRDAPTLVCNQGRDHDYPTALALSVCRPGQFPPVNRRTGACRVPSRGAFHHGVNDVLEFEVHGKAGILPARDGRFADR